MKTYKEKAEAYVRQQLPELMELSKGCTITENKGMIYEVFKVYPPIKIGMEWRRGALTDGGQVDDITAWEIIGHPIQLQHWLSAIRNHGLIYCEWFGDEALAVQDCNDGGTDKTVYFNLTTGQPSSEQDFKAFCGIVGVE